MTWPAPRIEPATEEHTPVPEIFGIFKSFLNEIARPPVEASLEEVARRAVEFVRRWDLEDAAKAAA